MVSQTEQQESVKVEMISLQRKWVVPCQMSTNDTSNKLQSNFHCKIICQIVFYLSSMYKLIHNSGVTSHFFEVAMLMCFTLTETPQKCP